jgi:YhcH/YjgK/YiaL family protein
MEQETMIVDQISNVNSEFYAGLLKRHGGTFKVGDRLMLALDFLQTGNVLELKPSRIELDGDKVFAMIQHYETKPKEQGVWEAHRKYIDVQYVAEGEELMGYANLSHLQAGEYNEEKDFLMLKGEGSYVLMKPGTFVILGPQDAHIPQVAVSAPQPVKKVVVKVAVAD